MIIKKLILAFILLGNMTSLFAQYFGSPDCHWVYNRNGRNGYTEVVYESDTVINNLRFNKFDIWQNTFSMNDTTSVSFTSLYLNNTDGLVLHSYDANQTDTLIDYNAAPGERWTFADRFESDYLLTVVDTFTKTFADRSYKALAYNIYNIERINEGIFRDTIYEHWGFRHNFILPVDWFDGFAGNNIGGGLLCFTNDALGTIEVGLDPDFWVVEPYPYECNEMPPLVDVAEPSLIPYALFPNPVSDWLTVSGLGIGSSYVLTGVSGEQWLRGELSFDGRIDVMELPAGIYFLVIDRVVQKFVKM